MKLDKHAHKRAGRWVPGLAEGWKRILLSRARFENAFALPFVPPNQPRSPQVMAGFRKSRVDMFSLRGSWSKMMLSRVPRGGEEEKHSGKIERNARALSVVWCWWALGSIRFMFDFSKDENRLGQVPLAASPSDRWCRRNRITLHRVKQEINEHRLSSIRFTFVRWQGFASTTRWGLESHDVVLMLNTFSRATRSGSSLLGKARTQRARRHLERFCGTTEDDRERTFSVVFRSFFVFFFLAKRKKEKKPKIQ